MGIEVCIQCVCGNCVMWVLCFLDRFAPLPFSAFSTPGNDLERRSRPLCERSRASNYVTALTAPAKKLVAEIKKRLKKKAASRTASAGD